MFDGKYDHGKPLSDIPSNRLAFGLNYNAAKWETLVKLELRAHKNDPGDGEKEIFISTITFCCHSVQVQPQFTILD